MLSNKVTTWISGIVVLAAFLIGFYFYPRLPAEVSSNWNALGVLPGHVSKLLALFLLPTVTASLITLLLLAPRSPKLHESLTEFRPTYNFLILLLVSEFAFFYTLTILFNLGFRFPFGSFVIFALGALFFAVGSVLPTIKRNWLIGIRTPWTLRSDRVWEKTHHTSAPIFKIAGGTVCLVALFTSSFVLYSFLLLVGVGLWSIVYSYLAFQRGS
jgi:uncharacterized membrane protein